MMAKFKVFKRTWWADDAGTIAEAGRKHYVRSSFATEDAARDFCQIMGEMAFGEMRRGPRGLAFEYEKA